jgi:hypothetical protein
MLISVREMQGGDKVANYVYIVINLVILSIGCFYLFSASSISSSSFSNASSAFPLSRKY